jgi:hypothetical protein
LLESIDLFVGQGIRLGNDGDQVDLGVQSLHDLNVERLQRVASGLNEEDAGVDTVVNDVHPVDLVLSIEIGVKALLNVVGDGTPRLIVVDKVTKARGIHNSQS